MKDSPVLIVDDDTDDREFLNEAWKELGYPNPLFFFDNGEDVIRYLESKQVQPFLILSDVKLPQMTGFELKEKILEDKAMNYKSIPFVFWSSAASKGQIQRAYDLGGNGFFIKGNSMDEIKQSLVSIVSYWLNSKVPD
ncbi:MAG TPA: response regulator [Chitinophagaceae bacterium]|nr:response regulator [Chitinophagaceae bacterium]